VISVRSLAFKRFLDLAKELKQPTVVVTDNDGNYEEKVIQKYKNYKEIDTIKICFDKNNGLNTLEPQLVEANESQLDTLRRVLGISNDQYPDKKSVIKYMRSSKNKTKCALQIFDTEEDIKFPKYIMDAIS